MIGIRITQCKFGRYWLSYGGRHIAGPFRTFREAFDAKHSYDVKGRL